MEWAANSSKFKLRMPKSESKKPSYFIQRSNSSGKCQIVMTMTRVRTIAL